MHFQTYTLLFVSFKAIYYVCFAIFMIENKAELPKLASVLPLFVVFSSGFVSYMLSLKISRYSKHLILRSLNSLMYSKFVFELYLLLRVFTNNKNVDMALFMAIACVFNFVRSLSKNLFLNCFNYEEKLPFYKDTLELERQLYTLFTGKELSHENTIYFLRNGPKYDSKTLFCILCDNPILNKYSMRFWEQNIGNNFSESVEAQHVDENYRFPVKTNDKETKATDIDYELREKETKDKIISQDKSQTKNLKAWKFTSNSSEDLNKISNERTIFKNEQEQSKNALEDSKIESNNIQTSLEKLMLESKINRSSLSKYFNDPSNTLRILTQGLDYELDYQDFHDNIRQMNADRSAYINFIDENTAIIRTITKVHWFFYLMIMFVFALQIFAFNGILKFVLYPFILLMFPIGFNMIESFFFIIYMHPFDIGDRVFIEDENLIVKSIRLTSTVFERWNNDYVIYTNRYLRGKILKNIRRSRNQTWSVSVFINKKDIVKAKDLEILLSNFCKENSAFEDIIFTWEEVVDSYFIKFKILVKHSINYQNGYFMCYVQNRFMKKLIFYLNFLKIAYEPMEYPIFLTDRS